jgi:hypothetical protein
MKISALNKEMKLLEHRGIVNGDWFFLYYLRVSNISLDFYLKQFNIDDYWIYKYSNKQKLVSIEEFMKFEYAGYIFFRKELYDKEHIELWVLKFNNFTGIQFLHKPLPPFSPTKIIIKK